MLMMPIIAYSAATYGAKAFKLPKPPEIRINGKFILTTVMIFMIARNIPLFPLTALAP